MKLKIFKTLWGHAGSLDDAIAACRSSAEAREPISKSGRSRGDEAQIKTKKEKLETPHVVSYNSSGHNFDGIEGQPPASVTERREFQKKLTAAGLDYIAEICTAGNYVPDRLATSAEHLESLRRQAEDALECRPLFLTIIAGCDAWGIAQSVDFFGEAILIAKNLGVTASFETHRSRSFFNPWTTRDILKQLPTLKLTCDFSHWCVVCERLIDTEPDVLALCAGRAHHVHARVGYDQGPQVPHPAAPEFRAALEAHENWWTQIWRSQRARGMAGSTMTPEFGPDGYLQCAPFTGKPVADLAEINIWMAARQKQRFGEIFISQPAKIILPPNLNPLAVSGKNI